MPTIEKVMFAPYRKRLIEIVGKKNINYIPTGLQEDIIYSVGCGKYQIIVAIDANRVGKTSAIVNIAKNIIWPENNEYFGFWDNDNVFQKWPFKTKRFRITGTPTNLADNGAIQQSIEQWWPVDKYTREKAGKHFYSVFKCGDWEGDALTYEQSAAEYEGQTLSLVLSDEPPKPSLIGAINSRMAEGGIWVIGMTPINCGIFLDVLDDLEEKGKRIKIVTGSVYENDVETGKPNHNSTKKGLWSKNQIDDFIAGIPIDERDARVNGKASHKSGKVFPMWDSAVHGVDFKREYLKNCDCYMAIDPHRKYYPAILWFAVTPSDCVIVYNEYPKFEDLGCFYDEARDQKPFNKSPEQLADIIKANDLSEYGVKILGRAIDPRFHAENPDLIRHLKEHGVNNWIIPDCEKIEVQRITLQQLMIYNPRIPLVGINTPQWYEDKGCKNSQRSSSRHYWNETKDAESEEYKDFIDVKRYFLNMVGGKPKFIERKNKSTVGAIKSMSELSMSGMPALGYFDNNKLPTRS